MPSFHADLSGTAWTRVARACCRSSVDPEPVGKSLLPGRRDHECATVRDALDPSTCEREIEKSRADEAGQMGAPLAPVQARLAEHPAPGYRAQADPDLAQERAAHTRHLATVLA